MRLFIITFFAAGLFASNASAEATPTPTPKPSPTPDTVKVLQKIPDTIIPANSQGFVINLSKHLKAPAAPSDLVMVNSSLGNFYIQLFPTNAPITVVNFLSYINAGAYQNTVVHRSVPGFIIQTGGYTLDSSLSAVSTFPAITNEFGLSNLQGTVAMALVGTNPDSATSQWFINLTNNSSILDASNTAGNPPFTVFGQVIGNGMKVVNAIAALPTYSDLINSTNYELNNSIFSQSSPFYTMPLSGVTTNQTGLYYANVVSITNVVTLPYCVTCSDTTSFSTEIQGDNVIIKPLVRNTVPATVTLSASDTNGNTVATSFQVSQEKLPQNIDFPTSYTTYSASVFSLPNNPSASSGLGVGVTFKSGPLKFTGGKPYLTGPGVLTLLATQPGNFFYAPAPSVIGYVIVDKGSQSITFPSIPNQTNSTIPFSLSLTNYPYSTVGLPVSVGVQSGPAMLKGTKLTVNGDGTITLSASQAGTPNFYPAPTVTTSFVVSPKPSPTPTPTPSPSPTS
jgi:cyclophilin family peptidyl-prolyl cis-trans isomerase